LFHQAAKVLVFYQLKLYFCPPFLELIAVFLTFLEPGTEIEKNKTGKEVPDKNISRGGAVGSSLGS
jgi:hypothetical protein